MHFLAKKFQKKEKKKSISGRIGVKPFRSALPLRYAKNFSGPTFFKKRLFATIDGLFPSNK